MIELHAFGDASRKGVAAAVYAVVVQEAGVNEGQIASKGEISKDEINDHPTSSVGVWPLCNKTPDKRECGFRRISHNCEALLARQHCHTTLDKMPRTIQAICEQ